jgi:hypothetical protein
MCERGAQTQGVFVLRASGSWTVLSSRDLLDASPFLKVRVETIRLPDGRCIPQIALVSIVWQAEIARALSK